MRKISEKMMALIQLVNDTFVIILRERRLPAKISENWVLQGLGYLKWRFLKRTGSLSPGEFVLIDIDDLGHRYTYQVLHLFSLFYPQTVFVWEFTLKNYIKLGHEGRRLFTLKNLKIASNFSTLPKPAAIVSSRKLTISQFSHVSTQILLETDVSRSIQELNSNTFLMPYGVHPALLQDYEGLTQKIQHLRHQKRSISIFFSGNTKYNHFRYFIEEYFCVPSRDHCVEFLLENAESLKLINITNSKQRDQIIINPAQYQEYSVVLCTCKGLAENWLPELASANFFLALPGLYMLMCHNVIEAMAVGSIPILSYENWFSPALVHGKNCFTYRRLEELPELIESINRMSEERIAEMRAAVIEYFDRYLNPVSIAAFLQTQQGSPLHVYMNTERTETLRKAHPDSILYRGGQLNQAWSQAHLEKVQSIQNGDE